MRTVPCGLHIRGRKNRSESSTSGCVTIFGTLTKAAVADPARANIAVVRNILASGRLHIKLEIETFRENLNSQEIGASAAGIKIKRPLG